MRNARLLPIFLIIVVDVLGLTIMIPLLPFYAEHYGASPFVVGCLLTSYAMFQLISGPILGSLSDRVGRRPLLLVSQIGTFFGFLLLGFAQTLWLIFLARIIDGITAGNLSLAAAYISDVTKPEERAKSFAIIGIAFGFGFLIGPGIAGYLSHYGYQTPIFAAAGLSFISILATYFLLPGGKPENSGTRETLNPNTYLRYFRDPRLSALLLQFACFAIGFSLFVSGFPMFSERRFHFGAPQVGYTYAYVGFLGILIQGGLIGKLVARFGERRLSQAGFFFTLMAYAVLAYSSDMVTLLAAATMSSIGHAILRPSITSLVSRKASPTEQGIVLGLTQSTTSLASIIAPLWSGLLIQYHHLSYWALSASGISLVGFLLSRRREAEATV